MDVHQNAKNTPHGRRLMVERLAEGCSVARVAAAAGVTPKTVRKWRAGHALEGEAGLADRWSRPHHSPTRLGEAAQAEILALRRQRLSGPAIARRLGRPVATVGLVLRRHRLGRLKRSTPSRGSSATSGHGPRADPARPQAARPDRRRRPPHPATEPSAAAASAGTSCMSASTMPPALPTPRSCRRAQGKCRRLPRARHRLVRQLGRHRRAGDDRQRRGLCQPRLSGSLRDRPHQAQAHLPLHAQDQRQGGTVHPDHLARMGLPASLHQFGRAQRRHAALAPPRQPTPTSLSPWRPASGHANDQGQPPW